MKDSEWPSGPTGAAESSRQETTSRRIALALLDEYSSLQEGKGYDPYNAQAGSSASDIWRHKHKRR